MERIREAMPSSTYTLFMRAMADRRQILCSYDGHRREICPIALGHKGGKEVALAYQFAGGSTTRLPPGGAWRCLDLAKVSDIQLRDGPWHAGSSHQRPQSCVETVDLDVNPSSPYGRRRRLKR
jgi:hypothetical protein